jgi:hypothetical protein
MMMDSGQDIAASQETTSGDKIETQMGMQLSQGKRFSLRIRSQPNIGHPPTVD